MDSFEETVPNHEERPMYQRKRRSITQEKVVGEASPIQGYQNLTNHLMTRSVFDDTKRTAAFQIMNGGLVNDKQIDKRKTLINRMDKWMVSNGYSDDTFYLAINLFDRVIVMDAVPFDCYGTCMGACGLIAVKYNELSDNTVFDSFTQSIQDMEKKVLLLLDGQLTVPTVWTCLQHRLRSYVSSEAGSKMQALLRAKIMDRSCLTTKAADIVAEVERSYCCVYN
jgi:Cyclin, N-terminal domain